MVYLWRAVDAEGEVLDVLVQPRRDKHAALKLMRKLLKKYGYARVSTAGLFSALIFEGRFGIHERGNV